MAANINFHVTDRRERVADRWDIIRVAPVPRLANTALLHFVSNLKVFRLYFFSAVWAKEVHVSPFLWPGTVILARFPALQHPDLLLERVILALQIARGAEIRVFY
jgi:hypothetical protein